MNQPPDPNEPSNTGSPEWGAPQPPPVAPASQYQQAPSYQVAPGTSPDAVLGIPAGVGLASSGRRIGGFFMEILLAIVTLGIGYVVWTLIVWARGQTPGKQVLHMRCYRLEDRRPAHWGWMLLRQFIGSLIYQVTLGIGFLVSAIMLISRSDRRTIPDFIAGTVVLYDPDNAIR